MLKRAIIFLYFLSWRTPLMDYLQITVLFFFFAGNKFNLIRKNKNLPRQTHISFIVKHQFSTICVSVLFLKRSRNKIIRLFVCMNNLRKKSHRICKILIVIALATRLQSFYCNCWSNLSMFFFVDH